eukprot:329107-Chlamydomonas_euryale.AAC.18
MFPQNFFGSFDVVIDAIVIIPYGPPYRTAWTILLPFCCVPPSRTYSTYWTTLEKGERKEKKTRLEKREARPAAPHLLPLPTKRRRATRD